MKTSKPPAQRTALRLALGVLILGLLLLAFSPPAASDIRRVRGQTVYIPAYSQIYHGDREQQFFLTVTLSIRNTDPTRSMTVLSVQYLDSEGRLLRKFLEKEVNIPPLASTSYVIKESDRAGGAGAAFLVAWKAEESISEPLLETVMIGTTSQQGISFTSRGQVVEETP